MYNGIIITDDMKNGKMYEGNTLKFGVTIDGINYILKFPKDGIESSVFSEHIASTFIRLLPLNCQETYLGWYKGTKVVLMRDFTSETNRLRAYKFTNQSSEGTNIANKEYTYRDVIHMIESHTKIPEEKKPQVINRFWDMFICDAILGNRDRHHGNWGYLMTPEGYMEAPIYDNGGSLFPGVDRTIDTFKINPTKFLAERAEKFPASLFRVYTSDGSKRTNYYQEIGLIKEPGATRLNNFRRNTDMNKIGNLAYNIVRELDEFISTEHKMFYVTIICARYEHIINRVSLEESCEKAIQYWGYLNGISTR